MSHTPHTSLAISIQLLLAELVNDMHHIINHHGNAHVRVVLCAHIICARTYRPWCTCWFRGTVLIAMRLDGASDKPCNPNEKDMQMRERKGQVPREYVERGRGSD
jgi:hypothetical protein